MTQSTFKNARTPDFIAYSIRQRPDQDADWKPVGVAFRHEDGRGINVLLHATPVDGKIVLRLPKVKTEAKPAAKKSLPRCPAQSSHRSLGLQPPAQFARSFARAGPGSGRATPSLHHGLRAILKNMCIDTAITLEQADNRHLARLPRTRRAPN